MVRQRTNPNPEGNKQPQPCPSQTPSIAHQNDNETIIVSTTAPANRAAAEMDSYNLKTASTYINNLLLARGLLRDGKPIEFVHPSRGEGGKEVTMAQIINLVHDLILKRDVRNTLTISTRNNY